MKIDVFTLQNMKENIRSFLPDDIIGDAIYEPS